MGSTLLYRASNRSRPAGGDLAVAIPVSRSHWLCADVPLICGGDGYKGGGPWALRESRRGASTDDSLGDQTQGRPRLIGLVFPMRALVFECETDWSTLGGCPDLPQAFRCGCKRPTHGIHDRDGSLAPLRL